MKITNMNHLLLCSTAFAWFMLAMPGAHAAPPTADLTVKGKLAVPVCTVTATDNGVYNIGKLSSTMVKSQSDTVLPSISKTWTITCDAETYLNFSHVDNRAESASTVARPNFGLGNVNGTGKLGFYTVEVINPTVDGATTRVFSTMTNTVGKENIVPYLSVHKENRHGWASARQDTQQSGKVFTADFVVTPTLASSAMMNGPITDDANIDGSMTLSFAYGI